MSVETRLVRAVSDLEQAFTPEPPPLPDRSIKPVLLTGALLAAVLVAGGAMLLAQLQGEGSGGDLDAVAAPDSETAPDLDVADTLFALASPPPAGLSFDRGTFVAEPPSTADIACAGCPSLEIRRSSWMPIGPQDLMTISLHRSLYRNPAGAEELTIRGRAATLAIDDWQQTLVWDEAQGLTVVIAANGYDRAELLEVAEALSIDSDSATVEAPIVPEGSTAVAAQDFASPRLLLQYLNADGSEIGVQVYETELTLTADRRTELKAAIDAAALNDRTGQLSFVESDDGIGVFFIGHDQSVMQFWNAEGLVLHMQADAEQVGQQALTELASSFKTVSPAAWEAAGGQ